MRGKPRWRTRIHSKLIRKFHYIQMAEEDRKGKEDDKGAAAVLDLLRPKF